MTATERDTLILEHMELAGRLAGAHARRVGADFDEVRSDAHLGLIVGVDRWLESDRSVDFTRWVVTRIVWTLKDEWRIREGLQRLVPTPRTVPLDYARDLGDCWWLGNDPASPEAEAELCAVDDRDYLEWLERAARADVDMRLAVAAASTPLAELGAAQVPPVTGSRVCQRVRIGRRKLRELAAADRGGSVLVAVDVPAPGR